MRVVRRTRGASREPVEERLRRALDLVRLWLRWWLPRRPVWGPWVVWRPLRARWAARRPAGDLRDLWVRCRPVADRVAARRRAWTGWAEHRTARVRRALRYWWAVRRPGWVRRTTWRPAPGGWATRPTLIVLGCVSGLLAVAALVLCALGVERVVGRSRTAAPPAAVVRPALHTAARPVIVPRSSWLDERTAHSQPPPRYDDRVVAVFVHHTDSPNAYDCADVPRIIRYLYAGQTGVRNWDDIGYNFLVDRCGTIYEGRAGGVDRAVTGAHTQGFNHRTAGIAAIGTFTAGAVVPPAMTEAIAALAAWKLGLADVDPRGTVRLVSSNSLSRYTQGTAAVLPTLAGHNAGFMTTCPGAALTDRLPAIRARAAVLQGRH